MRSTKKRIAVLAVIVALAGWWFFWATPPAYSLRVYSVPTGSMSPAIKPGDRICVEIRDNAKPKRGELWTFHMPTRPNIGVKRVIGLPGETLEIRSGRVLINGKPLREPYLTAPFTYSLPAVTLGPSEYFLLGDSRNASSDSHVFGPVNDNALIGRARLRYWPPTRLGGF